MSSPRLRASSPKGNPSHDTLYRVARDFGLPLAELKKLNKLTSDTLRPGQTLEAPKLEV